ncbi:MAG: hypothetical protein GY847_12060 [Proteobacteria bacterium]|nr:hypothetical protein [Pseudomonadota bacterium]
MDFEYLLKMSWKQYINGIIALVLFYLVGICLCITIVLIPTVTAGLTRGVLAYVREGRKPEFQELWNFDNYLQTTLLLIIGGLLIFLGYLLLIIPGVILSVLWLYSLFFIVDKKMQFFEAMSASREAVSGSGFFQHLVLLLIILFLNGFAGAMGFVGTLLTTPFALVLTTLAYLELTEPRRLVENNGEKGL